MISPNTLSTFFTFFWYLVRFLILLSMIVGLFQNSSRWCNDNLVYLWLMLVCFNITGSLKRFFSTYHRIFPSYILITIRFITRVTKLLWEFCTISNTLPLLSYYQNSATVFFMVHFQRNKEISKYLHHFQCITTRYYQVFKKKV